MHIRPMKTGKEKVTTKNEEKAIKKQNKFLRETDRLCLEVLLREYNKRGDDLNAGENRER